MQACSGTARRTRCAAIYFLPLLSRLLLTISLGRLRLPSLPSPGSGHAAVRLCSVDKPEIADLGGR